jgi:hypothetical protein
MGELEEAVVEAAREWARHYVSIGDVNPINEAAERAILARRMKANITLARVVDRLNAATTGEVLFLGLDERLARDERRVDWILAGARGKPPA